MPIYLYRCQNCQNELEKLQKVADPPLTDCPHCQQSSLKKVLAPVGIIFKGTGFHKNDYSASKGSSGSTAAKPAAAAGETASDSKTSAAASSSESTATSSSPATGGSEKSV